jgi:hypothetical protein
MAVIARINNTGAVGKATIRQTSRSTIASQNFAPKPNVTISEISGVSTANVQDGYALVYNSSTGLFEAEAIEAATTISQITGGSF